MTAPRSRQAERSEETRRALLDAGRALFAERGFAAVGTEEIVRAARVTRGALYHHFADKRALFEAVFEDVEADFMARLGAQLGEVPDPVALLERGIALFLDVATDPSFARISLVDAPAVLGWTTWRAIDLKHGLGLLQAALEAARTQGRLREDVEDVVPLAHLLLGALGEAGMMVAHAEDPPATRAAVEAGLRSLLAGLTR